MQRCTPSYRWAGVCHSERSEESHDHHAEILRFAQDDTRTLSSLNIVFQLFDGRKKDDKKI